MLIAESGMPLLALSSTQGPHLPAPRQALSAAALHIHPPGDALRSFVESFIQKRYQERFGAQLTEWLPTLVSVQCNGAVVAAAGYRDGRNPLFLERYLVAPIEHYLSDRGVPVARSVIVEAGQFAADCPGAGRLLVPLLAWHLRQQGFVWAVSTLTSELHHLFTRMGLAHQALADAAADRLSAKQRQGWGSYYAHSPKVFAAALSDILERTPENGA